MSNKQRKVNIRGRLAASVVFEHHWKDNLPREYFEAVYSLKHETLKLTIQLCDNQTYQFSTAEGYVFDDCCKVWRFLTRLPPTFEEIFAQGLEKVERKLLWQSAKVLKLI